MFDMNYLKNRHFGQFGGRYVPEMLIPALDQLDAVYEEAKNDSGFQNEFQKLLKNFAGRPTPLIYAKNLTKHLGGAKIYLKNEGLLHTGAHKLNNALGQALLSRQMVKSKILAETGAGQHGLATSTAAAKLQMGCKVFMGSVDVKRQYPNLINMEMLGAEVVSVEEGTKTLKDAVNMALKFWIENLDEYHYIIGSALGPWPYPLIVRDFQSVIGREVKEQLLEYEGKDPDHIYACVGGGSNSLGIFYPYLESAARLVGVEAGGIGSGAGENAARFMNPQVGIVQGYKSYFIQNAEGQVDSTHSISAGLDYAGIGPELAHLGQVGRVSFERAGDQEALDAFKLLIKAEGVFPALESSHAVAVAIKEIPKLPSDQIVVINVSGQGNKDLFITSKYLFPKSWKKFLEEEIKSC